MSKFSRNGGIIGNQVDTSAGQSGVWGDYDAFSLKKNINKGIDIKGKAGQRVSAAADGMVVYAGGNLRGYGKLVIIKHNESFLSAYGNNQEILVREGEQVKGGQMVAKVGTTAGKVEMLHFEVRLNGRPEDPLKYLP